MTLDEVLPALRRYIAELTGVPARPVGPRDTPCEYSRSHPLMPLSGPPSADDPVAEPPPVTPRENACSTEVAPEGHPEKVTNTPAKPATPPGAAAETSATPLEPAESRAARPPTPCDPDLARSSDEEDSSACLETEDESEDESVTGSEDEAVAGSEDEVPALPDAPLPSEELPGPTVRPRHSEHASATATASRHVP